jgi:amino acid adenylation domain-containing protein
MPADAAEGFRLSPQQRRLVRCGGLDGRLTAVVTVTGEVDGDRLLAAADGVTRRHEALRTRFAALPGGGLPLQVIEEAAPGSCRIVVSRAGGEWRVSLDVVAMCADAASCDVLLAEIAAGYAGPADAAEPMQYADVAEWFNEQLDRADETARAHWAERMTQADGQVGRQAARWTARRLTGAAETLRALARAEALRPEAVVLAAWSAVLRGTCPQGLPLVRAARDGRRFSELRSVVGPVETVTPVDVTGAYGASLLGAARALGRELEEADARAEALPVDEQATLTGFRWLPERRTVHAAGALFTLDDVRPFERPFSVMLRARTDGADLLLELGAAVGDPSLPETLGDRMARLTEAALRRPGLPLARHHLLSAAETSAAVGRLNPRRRRTAPGPAVVAILLEHAAARPGSTAAVSAVERLSYGDLARQSGRVAARLAALGVRPEEVVAVLADNSIARLVAVVGVWRAGCACLAIDSTVPPGREAAQLAHVGARFAVAAPGWEAPPAQLTVVAAGEDGPGEAADGAGGAVLPGDQPPATRLAFVTFTSGTTGRPKGVAVEHGQLAAYAGAIADVLGLAGGMTLASPAAPSADLGMTAWLVALHQGARYAVLPVEAALDPQRFAAAMRGLEVDVLKITPTHLEALLGATGPDVLPGHTLVLGGEQLPAELVARVRALAPGLRVINHYGPTEATVGGLAHVVGDTPEPGGEVPIGYALASALALPGGDGPAPDGALAAELWLAGEGVARGYYGDPRATADAFRPAPGNDVPGGRAYRTGDLIRLDAAGAAVFAGRADDQVKIRGVRVELAEVKRELRGQPGVTAAVVSPVGQGLAARLEAWVTGTGLDPDALTARLRAALPEPMVPARVHVVDAVPRTASGKPDLAALLAMRGTARHTGRMPEGPAEFAIAAVFQEVLGAPVTDAHASFFDLGGHSLLATLAIARLRDNLGLATDVEAFFAGPTVAAIAATVGPEDQARLEIVAAVGQLTDEEVARELDRRTAQ